MDSRKNISSEQPPKQPQIKPEEFEDSLKELKSGEPKVNLSMILVPFLREKLPEVFDYREFAANPKQNIRQYQAFAKRATETVLKEMRAFLDEQGVR
jgi:hypothetical protein